MKKQAWKPNPRVTPLVKTANVLAAAFMAVWPVMSYSARAADLPSGASVVHGSVDISTAGKAMNINQATGQAIINWESFGIGEGYGVYVNQPAVTAAMLSRVTGADPSQILGVLQANGIFYLVNPNGVYRRRSG